MAAPRSLKRLFGWVLVTLLVAAVAQIAHAAEKNPLEKCNEDVVAWRPQFDALAKADCFDLKLDGDDLMSSIDCGNELCTTECV